MLSNKIEGRAASWMPVVLPADFLRQLLDDEVAESRPAAARIVTNW